MNLIGNILWCVLGGLFSALCWAVAGVFWCITVVGIPVGLQCFKFASLTLCPFGKTIVYGGGAPSLLLNLFWLLLSGLPMAFANAVWGCVLCLTVIGIPFGLQFFKIAKLALMPFGSRVVPAL